MNDIDEIGSFFEGNDPLDNIKLSSSETVCNGRKFVFKHISFIRSRQVKRRHDPYIFRLKKYYNICNSKIKNKNKGTLFAIMLICSYV